MNRFMRLLPGLILLAVLFAGMHHMIAQENAGPYAGAEWTDNGSADAVGPESATTPYANGQDAAAVDTSPDVADDTTAIPDLPPPVEAPQTDVEVETVVTDEYTVPTVPVVDAGDEDSVPVAEPAAVDRIDDATAETVETVETVDDPAVESEDTADTIPDFEIDRSSIIPDAPAEEDDAESKEEPRRSWFGRLFRRDRQPDRAVEPEPAEVVTETPAPEMELEVDPDRPLSPEEMLAAQEEVRRQALEMEGLQNFDKGVEAMNRNEFEEALRFFAQALNLMPNRPHTVEIRNQARQNQAECEYRLALNLYKEDNLVEARNSLRRALGYFPNHTRAMRLNERIREEEERRRDVAEKPVHQRHTPEYQAKVRNLQEAIQLGNQYMSINELDKAEEEFHRVLLEDPLNAEAAAHLQRLAERRFRLQTDQMDRFQSEMITSVRQAWTPPVKRVVVQPREVGVDAPGVDPGRRRRLMEKLNTIMIPQLDFRQANIHDVIKYIDQQARAADTDSPPNERGVNIVLNLQRTMGAPTVAPGTASLDEDPFAIAAPTPDVSGVPTVTLTLRNVYLIDAIKFITEMTGLKYRIESDVVIITPADMVVGEVITRTYKIQPGVISEHVLSSEPESTGGLFDFGGSATASSGGGGSADIRRFFVEAGVPFPEGTSIVYKSSLNLMIVSNTAENLERFERILNMLNVVPIQVEIEARFVEVQQSDLEELGFEWLLTDNWILAQESGPNAPLPVSARERVQMNRNNVTKGLRYLDGSGDTIIPATRGTAGGILSISSVLTSPQLSFILHALEQSSGANLLSAPKVTTRTGSNAEIKVVRELIYPTDYEITPAQTLGTVGAQSFSPPFVTPTSFDQRDLGVILNVTPTVGPDNYTIDLIMMPQVVELAEWINYGSSMPDGRDGFVDMNLPQPIFHSRTIATSISIWDGQTVVMGGLITEGQQTTQDKVPFLGDIPLLGALFRSKSTKSVKRNLLIFVTANLVDPAGNRINTEDSTAAVAAGAAGAAGGME